MRRRGGQWEVGGEKGGRYGQVRVTDHWSSSRIVTGYWRLVNGHWSVVSTGHWTLDSGHWMVADKRVPPDRRYRNMSPLAVSGIAEVGWQTARERPAAGGGWAGVARRPPSSLGHLTSSTNGGGAPTEPMRAADQRQLSAVSAVSKPAAPGLVRPTPPLVAPWSCINGGASVIDKNPTEIVHCITAYVWCQL